MELNNNIILFASFGTMSFGINIKNLYNIILTHPYKSKIRNLQSIRKNSKKIN